MNTQPIEAVPHIPEADTFDLGQSLDFIKRALIGHRLLILVSSLFDCSGQRSFARNVPREQFLDFAAQLVIVTATPVEEAGPFVRGQPATGLEQLFDELPALRVHPDLPSPAKPTRPAGIASSPLLPRFDALFADIRRIHTDLTP